LSNYSSFLHFAFSFNSSRSSIQSQKKRIKFNSTKKQKSDSIEKIQILNSKINKKFKTKKKTKILAM
jgi:hypothetical protein